MQDEDGQSNPLLPLISEAILIFMSQHLPACFPVSALLISMISFQLNAKEGTSFFTSPQLVPASNHQFPGLILPTPSE
jgi:hypothetical protein